MLKVTWKIRSGVGITWQCRLLHTSQSLPFNSPHNTDLIYNFPTFLEVPLLGGTVPKV